MLVITKRWHRIFYPPGHILVLRCNNIHGGDAWDPHEFPNVAYHARVHAYGGAVAENSTWRVDPPLAAELCDPPMRTVALEQSRTHSQAADLPFGVSIHKVAECDSDTFVRVKGIVDSLVHQGAKEGKHGKLLNWEPLFTDSSAGPRIHEEQGRYQCVFDAIKCERFKSQANLIREELVSWCAPIPTVTNIHGVAALLSAPQKLSGLKRQEMPRCILPAQHPHCDFDPSLWSHECPTSIVFFAVHENSSVRVWG